MMLLLICFMAILKHREPLTFKIMFCGDATQTDLTKTNERNGIVDFMKILQNMPSFDTIEFNAEDICRSGLVKEYIISKLQLGIEM